MGLFDRFRKKVRDAVDDADFEKLSVEEESPEAKKTITPTNQDTYEGEWDDVDAVAAQIESKQEEDEWEDDWDEEEEIVLPRKLTRKERKLIEKTRKEEQRKQKELAKEMKRRGAKDVGRLSGSRVNLHMMRTTTGRKLVDVKQAPRGSSGQRTIAAEGKQIGLDLGGGIVESGGRIIKSGQALDELLEELEWVMLESDISSESVTILIDTLRKELVGSRLRKGADLSKVVEASLKRALRNLMQAGYWDYDATIRNCLETEEGPVVVMFVGVNGTGKTTTIAKVANRLTKQGLKVVSAAGDTFRAGAIEQLETHCERLGIRCISSQRGGDSAAIARDAVESAKAKGEDVVLIDTAGRMQNKTNLMNELEKVRRIANPHLTLFVGDALAGNDAVDQAVMFQQMLKFDGAVLTKVDTDAKGGAGLSIAYATGRPIVLIGVGQGYDDIKQFDADWLLEQLFE